MIGQFWHCRNETGNNTSTIEDVVQTPKKRFLEKYQSKSSRKDDIHEVATSKTFVAGAESPALKRTIKNKKDADESTSSCPVCKNSEHYCKICKRRCCALCKVSGELNNHICKSCSKPPIPDQDPDNGWVEFVDF